MINLIEDENIVGPKRPPKTNITTDHFFERSSDPFHAKAAPEEFKSEFKQGVQDSGWMAIDWVGNPIGFFADGTKMPTVSLEENMKDAKCISEKSGVKINIQNMGL